MIPRYRHIAALAGSVLMAGPAVAQADDPEAYLDKWIEDRARVFSQVCMGGAPGFGDLRDRALAAGFEDQDGKLTFPPEVVVSLKDYGETCACFMTLGAPEPARMMVGVIDRLRADYPDAFREYDREGGHDYASYFTRDGVEVVLELTFHTFKDLEFLAGFVIAPGGCPA